MSPEEAREFGIVDEVVMSRPKVDNDDDRSGPSKPHKV
jgi:hypothetical protein